MAIPDFQSLMLPILQILKDGRVRPSSEIREEMAQSFSLTEEERNELLPSGTVPRFDNNISWALSYLVMALLVSRPSRGHYVITPRGKEVLATSPERIDMRYLTRFPEYVEKRGQVRRGGTVHEISQAASTGTPEELIEAGYQILRDKMTKEILSLVHACSPRFFERLVIQLLLRMGYGGSLQDAGQVIGKSGDGGIDGVIKEDKLGLDVVYVQAKRWNGNVPASAVRDFSGSLDSHGAKKGVFITTSDFSKEARIYVSEIKGKKIVLIDGDELARLMIDHDVGVSTVNTYTIKKIDSDYFEEE